MNRRVLILTGLWLLGLVAAYQVGRLNRAPAVVARVEHRQPRETRGGGGDVSPAVALKLADLRAFPKTVLGLETNDDFQKSFEELQPSLEDGSSHDALFMLADVWSSRDPVAATNWLAKLKFSDARNPYLFSSLSQWASKDPDAATAWLEAHPEITGESRDYLLAGLLRGMATSDPDAALEMLLKSPAGPERTGSLDFLIRAWSSESLENALEKVAGLPESVGNIRQVAIRKLTDNLTTDQLATARTWAGKLITPVDRDAALSGIAARWSQTDPVAATAWAESLTDPAARAGALGETSARWARIDPPEARAWLAGRKGQPDVDLAARAIAWTTVSLDPDHAFSEISAITHEPLRDETFEQVGRFWLSRDPQAARTFLERESALPPAIREKLLLSFE